MAGAASLLGADTGFLPQAKAGLGTGAATAGVGAGAKAIATGATGCGVATIGTSTSAFTRVGATVTLGLGAEGAAAAETTIADTGA